MNPKKREGPAGGADAEPGPDEERLIDPNLERLAERGKTVRDLLQYRPDVVGASDWRELLVELQAELEHEVQCLAFTLGRWTTDHDAGRAAVIAALAATEGALASVRHQLREATP